MPARHSTSIQGVVCARTKTGSTNKDRKQSQKQGQEIINIPTQNYGNTIHTQYCA